MINESIKLTETEKLVCKCIEKIYRVNKRDIAKTINKIEMTIQRSIKYLIELNLIKRIGSNKTGYWEIIN